MARGILSFVTHVPVLEGSFLTPGPWGKSLQLYIFKGWKWKLFSRVRLFAAPWIAARQVPLSMGILQGRILEWVAMPSSRGSSQPRGRTSASCLLHLQASSLSVSHLGSLQEFTTRWQIKSLNVTMMHNSVFVSNIISIGNTWLCSIKTLFTKTGSELYLIFEL